ncbi:MAG: fumarylacetoacetate hydrolase family protein [Fusobacterium varium]|uniref:fumarylacetoacetate hydrolase family protein n=1 Tax=Fusobacterium varium TaxID=856 RepID=UPI00242AD205|nr:fumarylacetoacetate hydrolase family protein [Fusobacterium varium]UYI78956.1 MAG: fumarylacetoacetate hydrolase family protein [Fusobacterium varium]
MKFVRFKSENNEKLGIFNKDESKIIEISSVLKGREFSSMIDLIENITEDEMEQLQETFWGKISEYVQYDVSKVKICSPIKRPIHDIICVGVNYKSHLEETKESFKDDFTETEKTVYFSKRASEIIGTGDAVKSRMDLDTHLDYEVELAVIIGKKGSDIAKEDVEKYIFGYSIFNDISARELQQSHFQWYRGKSLDTYSSMGPCILHKTALSFPIEVDVKSYVNKELRQSSNTRLFLADIPQIISEISAGITLEPGDIIITGTPSGVGMGMKPQGFMKKGDVVTCEIPEIGKLINTIE